jgi:hypothetical protein
MSGGVNISVNVSIRQHMPILGLSLQEGSTTTHRTDHRRSAGTCETLCP